MPPPPPTHSADASSSSPPPPPHTNLALEIGLIVFGIILIIGAILIILGIRRHHPAGGKHSSQGQDANHPASRITPFYSRRGDTSPHGHAPGSNMRIANRDIDGSWKFSSPGAPFTPSGISEVSPSPSSSTYRSGQPSPNRDVELESPSDKRYQYDDEIPTLEFHPPPAYGYDVGYIDHGKG